MNAIPFNETYAPSSKDENAPSIIKLILMLVFIFLIALALILDYNDFFDTGQERQKSSIIQEGNLTDKNKTNDDISKMEKN